MAMDPLPPRTTLAALLRGHQVFALRYGIEPETLCEHAGVPLDGLADPYRIVPFNWLLRYWRSLIALLPEVDVGIEIGLFWSFDRLGLLGEAVRYLPSPLAALRLGAHMGQKLARSTGLHTAVGFEESEHSVAVVVPKPTWDDVPERTEALAFFVVSQLRLAQGASAGPVAVQFDYHCEQRRRRYEEFFGCDVRFGCDDTRLVFDRSVMTVPNANASARAVAHFEAYVRRLLAQNLPPPLLADVRGAIAAQLARGVLTQASVARALGMSGRTLQRKLEDAGTTFRELSSELRHAAAIRLLTTTDHSLSQVAAAVGYADLSSFLRAFRRWTGRGAADYRESAAAAPVSARA